MMNRAAFVLSIVIASSSAEQQLSAVHLPTLNTPRNLRVGQEEPTSAVLQWDFDLPWNLPIRDVGFVIWLEARRMRTRKFHHSTGSEPLEFKFDDLMPDIEYVATILAMSDGWQSSRHAPIAFRTMAQDWLAPSIESVIKSGRDDFGTHIVTWTELPQERLKRFEIEVCDQKCSTIQQKPNATSAEVPIEYNSNFTVRVIACYDVPVVGYVRRYGKYFSGTSGPTPVSKLLKSAHYASRVGNRIRLQWHPPFAERGPTSYYEVFVGDNSARSFFGSHVFRDDLRAYASRPVLEDSVYKVTVMDEDEEPTAPWLLHAKRSGYTYCRPPKPLMISVVMRTRHAARFRIVFQKSAAKVEDATHLQFGPGLAETFGLSAFATLDIAVRSCVTYGRGRYDSCGNFSIFQVLSNTAAPTPVTSLNWHFEDADKVVVTWQEPEESRGPIDGYKVTIRGMYGRRIHTDEKVLGPAVRSFVFENFNSQQQFKIGVAAFNLDLENQDVIHEGEWSYVEPSRTWIAAYLGLFLVSSFFGLVICGLIVHCFKTCREGGVYPPQL